MRDYTQTNNSRRIRDVVYGEGEVAKLNAEFSDLISKTARRNAQAFALTNKVSDSADNPAGNDLPA